MRRSGNTFAPGSSLFSPSIIRGLTGDANAVVNVTAASLSGSIQSQTGSFRFDPPGTPLKSTQQLPVDWSKFENHTFFNSAEAKVNTAFDLIINNYPFDGTRGEVLSYLDRLTGFERYVLDEFPKSLGYLNFSGSAAPLGGTYISVKDSEGASIPSLARAASGARVLDQGAGPISFEFHLAIPENLSQGNQVIIQRLQGGDHGITLALSSTLNTDPSGSLLMLVSSGTASYLSASMAISKGEFQQVCAVYDARPTFNRIQLFRNAELQAQSSQLEMGDLGYGGQPLTIGSGSSHSAGSFGGAGIQFSETLSGSIDELRVYHRALGSETQKKYLNREIYTSDDLRLYFKFNEPTGSYPGNLSVIDSSGRGLHSTIVGASSVTVSSLRSGGSALIEENPDETPILFPSHPAVISLNSDLLASASQYDAGNPNMITKLIPRHYLQEASIFEGFGQNNELGDIDDPYGTQRDFPGGGVLGSAQVIASLLFLWAKQFDEIKMQLDQFGRLNRVDPLEPGTIASTFLPFLAETYGITLPEMFPNASYDQFYDKVSLTTRPALSENGLQYVQNQIWRRVLTDLVEIFRSKGTIHSIKSLIRDMGINPEASFRFREFGGSRTGRLSDQRVKKTKLLRMLDFSGSYGSATLPLDPQGIPADLPHFSSPGLFDTSPRVEPGYPAPSGDPLQDGILTSGSWTYEATYRMTSPMGMAHPATSSLVRFATSGTSGLSVQDSTFLNLVAFSGSIADATTSSLSLFFRDTWSQTDAPILSLPLTGVDIFDGEHWHLSFGRERNDSFDSIVSSSWFLRAGKQQNGRLVTYATNAILFDDSVPIAYADTSILTTTGSVSGGSLNVTGTVIHIGSQSVPSGASLYGLSHASVSDPYKLSSFFGGKVMGIRFWTKALTELEDREHSTNPLSVGVDNAKANFNFNTSVTGSWERVRLDLDLIQVESDSDTAGQITLVDMSQNGRDCLVTGLEPSANVLKPEHYTYSTINPNFDQSSSDNKVRVRSWSRQESVDLYGGVLGPLHEIPEDETSVDDTRFSMEVNAVQALNEDILRIFSSLDAFDSYIGRPELQFSDDYPDLAALRDVYFNRLTDRVNFKTFFEFFKWFDGTISHLIEMLIPRKTKFLGVNFIIEPHMLERPKIRYNTFDLYLGPNDRNRDLSQLLVQQLVADLRRY